MNIEKLNWKANYIDGTSLLQTNPDGTSNKYDDIDRTKLINFEIVDTESNKTVFKLHLEPEQKLICRIKSGMNMGTNEVMWRFMMVGWQQNVNGKNIQSITYIMEDGRIEQAGKWVGSPPVLRAGEI